MNNGRRFVAAPKTDYALMVFQGSGEHLLAWRHCEETGRSCDREISRIGGEHSGP